MITKSLGFINIDIIHTNMGYYDDIAEGYNELHGEEQLKKLRIVKKKLEDHEIKITPGTKLLDVGCGTGISTDFWDCDATGIDPSEGLIRQNINKGKKSRLIAAHAENIPFPDKSFDIVLSITAIQNFDDVEKGLKEIKRVGKGCFVLSFLKKSEKADMIKGLIENMFDVNEIVEEEKDWIVFA